MNNIYKPITTSEWKKATFKGLKWEYVMLGSGEDTLILFPGGLRRPVYGGAFVKELGTQFKILIPVYPRISNLNHLAEGVARIMDHEDIESTHLFGSSFGGLMAQAFIVFYPDRVKKVVISNTGTKTYELKFSKRISRVIFLIRVVPAFIARKIMIRSFTKLVPSNVENYEEIVNLIQGIIKSKQLDKKDIICHFESLLNFQNNLPLTKEVASSFQHKLLIITAANDKGVSPEASSSLEKLYPEAKFHHFMEGGHMPMLVKPNEYVQLVKGFLLS
ncbi:MAG: alpha/beta fold hydrolase [Candidatus Hodarchaeota archaeon]